MSQQIGFEPFFKPGQKVKILPMTQRMRRYSASRYYEGDLGEVISLSDQITIKLDEPDQNVIDIRSNLDAKHGMS